MINQPTSDTYYYNIFTAPLSSITCLLSYLFFVIFDRVFLLTDYLQDDAHAGDELKEATEACEVLRDDSQRPFYDQSGHLGIDPNFQHGNMFDGCGNLFCGGFKHGSFHFSSQGGQADQTDSEEFFDALGRQRRRQRGPRRGVDLQMHVRLSFADAVFGASHNVHLRYHDVNQAKNQGAT